MSNGGLLLSHVIEGDCIEVMQTLPESSVDAIVTDPPYGLGFMGKHWDALPPGQDWAEQCLRVLKPGGHLLAFGGTRTYHRLAVAIEDAGFEIRDTIAWMYATGFPKSHNVSKAIDKALGAERQVVGLNQYAAKRTGHGKEGVLDDRGPGLGGVESAQVTAPATPEAEQWDGWGTALKPAMEPVVVARKPFSGTVAANVLEHGTGGLNIDACRIEGPKAGGSNPLLKFKGQHRPHHDNPPPRPPFDVTNGRWPANVMLDEAAAAALDEQSGLSRSPGNYQRSAEVESTLYGKGMGKSTEQVGFGDRGGASRFFYCAKASTAERNAGLEAFDAKQSATRNTSGRMLNPACDNTGKRISRCECGNCVWSADSNPKNANNHPTVKPIAVMQWLVKLVTPPGGTVLDPFTGSGTTGIAALSNGFQFIGIEREAEYVLIAEQRITASLTTPIRTVKRAPRRFKEAQLKLAV